MVDRLELEARFNDKASAGVKRFGKTLEALRPSNGMQAAQKWMNEFRAEAEKVGVAVRPISSGLSAIGVGGLAAGLSLGELVKQFRELADSTATMKELGRQSGMTTTQIARLQYAASKLHVDPAAITGALNTWSSKMLDFRRHTGTFYFELLRQNSDVAAKIAAEDPAQGFRDTLDYLSRIPAAAQKAGASAADAAQIQKRWAEAAGVGDLEPMLAKGPKGLAEAYAEAAREVKPITPELERQADVLNQALNRFDQTWKNFKNEVGPTVLNGLSSTVDRLDHLFKLIEAHPGEAAIGGLGAAALYGRRRLMQRMAGAGSEAAVGRAAGALSGAGGGLEKAGVTLNEAGISLKEAAAELRGRGGPGAGNVPGGEDPKKPGGTSFDNGRAILATLGLVGVAANAPGLDESGSKERDANAASLSGLGNSLGFRYLDQARQAMFGKDGDAVSALRSWWNNRGGSGSAASDETTNGNILHMHDANPPGFKVQEAIKEGSKAGIIAGLRELTQQQALEGGGSFGGAAPGHGGNAGMPNLRYGRPKAGGQYRHGPGAQAGDPSGAFNPQAPTAPGTYRPQYKLSGADLDDRVVNTIAGEAVTSNPESIDAVVNNMLNRVGSKGWGPSGNLLEVARAPGQYAGYRKADAVVAERIRARIRAIASGGVHDNTNGSNAYRAAWYHGKWFQQHEADGRIVGGNRFAYEPWTKNGPYAPYPASKTTADAFEARRKALMGGAPGHAVGGSIRGPGGPRSDSIPAWLSNGEFVVNAKAAGRFLPFLHAINADHTYADGGQVNGAGRRRSWLDFFRRSMGARASTAFGATAMMMGESGKSLDPSIYHWDVNGPSGGTAQWHDVTTGRYAGKLHRLSNLMGFAMGQHADWKDMTLQQAFWKREAMGPLAGAWKAMRSAGTSAETLRRGVDLFENPANHLLEYRRRLPNIVQLARDAGSGGSSRVVHATDPVEVNIRHHRDGRVVVSGRAGRGVKLGLRTGPTMQPT